MAAPWPASPARSSVLLALGTRNIPNMRNIAGHRVADLQLLLQHRSIRGQEHLFGCCLEECRRCGDQWPWCGHTGLARLLDPVWWVRDLVTESR
jgi:hypothetical protein